MDGLTGAPQGNVPISFALTSVPPSAQGQSVGGSATTNPQGTAAVFGRLGDKLGGYKITATCPSCAAGRNLVFGATAIPADANDPNNPTPPKKKPLPNTGSSNSGGGGPPEPPAVTVTFDKPIRASLRVQYGKTTTLCASVSPASEAGKITFVDMDSVFDLRFPAAVPGCSAASQIGIEVTSRLDRCTDTGRIQARRVGTAQVVGTATGAVLVPKNMRAVRKTFTRNQTFDCTRLVPELVTFCIFHAFIIEMSGDPDMDLSGLEIREWKHDRTRTKVGGRELPFCPAIEDLDKQNMPIEMVGPGVFGIGDVNGYQGLKAPVSNCGSEFSQDVLVGTCKFVNDRIRIHVGPPFGGIPGGWGDITVTRPDEK